MGAYHGRWGFETFSHRKAVLVKPARPDPDVIYPPFTPLSRGSASGTHEPRQELGEALGASSGTAVLQRPIHSHRRP